MTGTGGDPDEGRDGSARVVLPAGVTAGTPLMSLPLSNRAVNALERQEVLTVGDLLTFPLSRIPKLAGVGPKTRREIIDAVAQLRDAIDNPAPAAEPAFVELVATTLTERSAALLPTTTRKQQAALVAVARGLLGVDELVGSRWPTQAGLAAQCGITAGRVSQLTATLRQRWVKLADLHEVADWVWRELLAAGGVAASVQLAQRLAVVQPDPAAPPDAHQRAARALVRAALLAEDLSARPRWVLRRQGDAMMAALTATGLSPDRSDPADPADRGDATGVPGDVQTDAEMPDRPAALPSRPTVAADAVAEGSGQGLADYAAALAEAADALVHERGVVPRWALLDALHGVPRPDAAPPLDDARLVDLVTGLSTAAAVNARLELYRRGLPARDALHHSRRAFITAAGWTPHVLADKVRARYPEAEPLPTDPDRLRALLADCGIDLRWDADGQHVLRAAGRRPEHQHRHHLRPPAHRPGRWRLHPHRAGRSRGLRGPPAGRPRPRRPARAQHRRAVPAAGGIGTAPPRRRHRGSRRAAAPAHPHSHRRRAPVMGAGGGGGRRGAHRQAVAGPHQGHRPGSRRADR